MSTARLSELGLVESICFESAIHADLGKDGHLLANPDLEERRLLDIEAVGDILQNYELDLFMSTNMDRGKLRIEAERRYLAHERVVESHGKREIEWLRRLMDRNRFPVLFVCGAHHVNSFANLARSLELIVTVLHNCWTPQLCSNDASPEY